MVWNFFLIAGLAAQPVVVKNQGFLPFGDGPIFYRTSRNLRDPAAKLQQQLDRGEAKLEYEPGNGYLKSVLGALEIPVSSQTLVFSKTSFQYPYIAPESPRALYFNDDVYVGKVHQSKSLVFVSFDPMQGAVFYILDEQKTDRPRFERSQLDCVQCHNITAVNQAGVNQVANVPDPQNAYDLRGEWSLSTQDIPNRFTTAISYVLPVGRHHGRVLDLLAAGWAVNAVGVLQSGYPLSITQPNNNSVIGGSYQRPNATGIDPGTTGTAQERLDGWFNPAAFTQAAQFTFGNVSRFINVRGPSTRNLDLSLFKTFSIKERIRAQFRAEALNATNTPIFGKPNTNIYE